ncbi:MAG: alanine racemase [bacterium]|nr:alanine racemase [bacterium]
MRSTNVLIDLSALEWNLGVVRRRTDGRKVLGMVKANAYGHGIVQVSKVLQSNQIDMLGVAFVDEGVLLREAGIQIPIMVLTPPERSDVADILRFDLTTVVSNIQEAEVLNAAASARRPRVHVYIDTGMRRDGVRAEHAVAFVEALGYCTNLDVEGICTHLATSEEPDSAFVREQLSTFAAVLRQLSARGHTFAIVHAANTGGIWQSAQSMFTMVRPGLSLYGYAPPHDDIFTLRPVMSIVSKVLSLRTVHAGETVSYGRRWMASQDTTIATIPLGYGDGYLRALTGKASCLIHGKTFPIVGTICMDECMVDVGDYSVEVGDDVVMLGRQSNAEGHVQSIDALDIANWANTIPYEITTAISARVPRIYVKDVIHV